MTTNKGASGSVNESRAGPVASSPMTTSPLAERAVAWANAGSERIRASGKAYRISVYRVIG